MLSGPLRARGGTEPPGRRAPLHGACVAGLRCAPWVASRGRDWFRQGGFRAGRDGLRMNSSYDHDCAEGCEQQQPAQGDVDSVLALQGEPRNADDAQYCRHVDRPAVPPKSGDKKQQDGQKGNKDAGTKMHVGSSAAMNLADAVQRRRTGASTFGDEAYCSFGLVRG